MSRKPFAVICFSLGILLASALAAAEPGAMPDSLATLAAFRKPPREVTMVVDGFLWIDAEDFADYGGWRLDTQFVYLMGSPYLLAGGVGTPVRDAVTEIQVPKAGVYRLWVRAKNWIPEYSPGKFTVSVAGKRSAQVFGAAPTDKWIWQSAGEFQLDKGPARIELHDLTGYFARCDALVLTTDLGYAPPEDVQAIEKERSRLTGLSLQPRDGGRFDVVVVGAGAAGCCAAVASARLGAKTVLVHDRPVLGGNASAEAGVGISGAGSLHPNARESGIIEEACLLRAQYGFARMSEAFQMLAEQERNLTVLYNERVVAVRMRDDRTIAAVNAQNTLTGQYSIYRGKLFIDATGDGWVGYFAGAKYRLGRESRDEFHEDLAPPQADKITMSGCLMGNLSLSHRAVDTGKPVRYVAPPWAAKLPPGDQFGRKLKGFASGAWWLEHQGEIDDLYDAERARDELIRIALGFWDYVKNSWPERQQAANYALVYVPHLNAKRETRRLVGDYMMTQQDAQHGVMFPDRISYGGWPLDVHHPQGIYSGKEGPFYCDNHVPIYSIPYRSLYSVNIENLLFAGRHVSVTHIALGTVRVQGTLATLGQAAGTAAALCLARGVTPRQLGQQHLGELQQTLLKHDQYIPELKNDDPADLARAAAVTASSTARRRFFTSEAVRATERHELTTTRAMMFPRGLNERIGSVFLTLSSERKEPVELVLHLREARQQGDFSSTEDLATAKATVRPGRATLVEFSLNSKVGAPYLWLWLPKTPGVWWSLMSRAPDGACRAYGGGGVRPWTVHEGQYYAFSTEPPLAYATDYRPENVVDGVARIVGAASHLWVSDPQQAMPQWIELEFPKPARMNTVYLTLDTDLNTRSPVAPVAPQCVRDYRLEYFDGGGWRELAAVKDNFQRRRVHRFDTVTASKLRLVVEATNGDPSARVFEMRAYQE